ncbi:MAG: hypothetical protein JWQ02_80 [Capsulimonas sp.]|jgi:hypothetical protein|nr:hypothetical protein [Capsulimonas sp.]
MKQPLMHIPPAQAEALYDAALNTQKQEVRTQYGARPVADDWDDRAPAEDADHRWTQNPSNSHGKSDVSSRQVHH